MTAWVFLTCSVPHYLKETWGWGWFAKGVLIGVLAALVFAYVTETPW
jgi:hypothetical protein